MYVKFDTKLENGDHKCGLKKRGFIGCKIGVKRGLLTSTWYPPTCGSAPLQEQITGNNHFISETNRYIWEWRAVHKNARNWCSNRENIRGRVVFYVGLRRTTRISRHAWDVHGRGKFNFYRDIWSFEGLDRYRFTLEMCKYFTFPRF